MSTDAYSPEDKQPEVRIVIKEFSGFPLSQGVDELRDFKPGEEVVFLHDHPARGTPQASAILRTSDGRTFTCNLQEFEACTRPVA